MFAGWANTILKLVKQALEYLNFMLCPSVFILEFRQAFTDYYFLK